jgi:hypothetical protein
MMVNDMAYSNYYEVIAFELRASIRRYNHQWLEIICRHENEQTLFLGTIEQYRLSVIVLSCALLEHTINFYLCTKCDGKKFEELERRPIFKKWSEVPNEFVRSYQLAQTSELSKDLTQLISRRKAIVHAKPMMSIDGDKRHKGNVPEIAFDEHEFIGRRVSLPVRLIDNLLKFDSDAFMDLSCLHTVCGTVSGEFSRAQYRIDYAARTPDELIAEIVAQGHGQADAKWYAALLGEIPRRNSDGTLSVQVDGQEIVRLNPLKFFSERK